MCIASPSPHCITIIVLPALTYSTALTTGSSYIFACFQIHIHIHIHVRKFTPIQALVVLHMWLEKNKESATGNELERALTRIERRDIIDTCMGNMQEVTDDHEKMEALAQLREGSYCTSESQRFRCLVFVL